MKFKCVNKGCEYYGVEVTVPRVTFRWDEHLMHSVIMNPPKCSFCNEEIELQKEPSTGEITCHFAKFNSKTSNEKKVMMKKRYREHSKNEVKEKVHEVRKSILGENYKLIPKGQ